MVPQGTVKRLSKRRGQMPLKPSSTLGGEGGGQGRRQAKRKLTQSFHSHQFTNLPNMIFKCKILVLPDNFPKLKRKHLNYFKSTKEWVKFMSRFHNLLRKKL